MKLLIRTFFFHIFCVILFTIIYSVIDERYYVKGEQYIDFFIDNLYLSSTIQSGVGMSSLYPITFYTKITIIIQQLLMIFTYVITLYVFTL